MDEVKISPTIGMDELKSIMDELRYEIKLSAHFGYMLEGILMDEHARNVRLETLRNRLETLEKWLRNRIEE